MKELFDNLTEDQKEEFGYRLGSEDLMSGYWEEAFIALGKGEEYTAFLKAYEEARNLLYDYLG